MSLPSSGLKSKTREHVKQAASSTRRYIPEDRVLNLFSSVAEVKYRCDELNG
jgi:hypothetical protein